MEWETTCSRLAGSGETKVSSGRQHVPILLEAERLRYGVGYNLLQSGWKLKDQGYGVGDNQFCSHFAGSCETKEWSGRKPDPMLLEAKRLRCGLGNNLLHLAGSWEEWKSSGSLV